MIEHTTPFIEIKLLNGNILKVNPNRIDEVIYDEEVKALVIYFSIFSTKRYTLIEGKDIENAKDIFNKF